MVYYRFVDCDGLPPLLSLLRCPRAVRANPAQFTLGAIEAVHQTKFLEVVVIVVVIVVDRGGGVIVVVVVVVVVVLGQP